MSYGWARNRYLDGVALGQSYNEYEWPHFPAAMLNSTTKQFELGSLVGDQWGNIYCYVKYIGSSTPVAGNVAGLNPFFSLSGTAQTYNTDCSATYGYISTDITGETENCRKGKLLLVDSSAAAGPILQSQAFIGTIAWNEATGATTSAKTKYQVKPKRYNEVSYPLGPGYPLNAGTETAPADNTVVGIVDNLFRVDLADQNASALPVRPCGVFIGNVSAGNTTPRYTWIQVFGIGPIVIVQNEAVNMSDTYVISTTPGVATVVTDETKAGFRIGWPLLGHTQANVAGLDVIALIDPAVHIY